MKNKLGLNIQHYRKLKRLEQKDLARLIEVGTSMISRYECGRTTPPLERLKAISEALGCSLYDLFKGVETKPQIIYEAPFTVPSRYEALVSDISRQLTFENIDWEHLIANAQEAKGLAVYIRKCVKEEGAEGYEHV